MGAAASAGTAEAAAIVRVSEGKVWRVIPSCTCTRFRCHYFVCRVCWFIPFFSRKACSFHCGDHVNDSAPDWDVGRSTVRWGYDPADVTGANGKGLECWPCSRVWLANISHTWPNRDKAEYQAKLAVDMKLLTNHKALKDNINAKARKKIQGEAGSTIQFPLGFLIAN